jgi:hypothetical protein
VIEAGLHAHLSADAGVAALVGTRIYPLLLPQSATYPALTYSRVSGPRLDDLDGDAGLAHPAFQVTAWAPTYKAAKETAAAVRLALRGYRGPMGAADVADVRMIGDFDLYDQEAKVFHVAADFEIWHAE